MAGELKSDKTAILVIHGIGQQNPYETIDQFSRGVFDYLKEKGHSGATLDLNRVAREGWTEVSVRIQADPPKAEQDSGKAGNGKRPLIDIYEYYWAPETQGKISYLQTLKWLLWADLKPFLYLDRNLQEMASAKKVKSKGGMLWLFVREVIRFLAFYIPLGLGLSLLLFKGVTSLSYEKTFSPLLEFLTNMTLNWGIAALGSLVSLALGLYFLFKSWSFIRRSGKSTERKLIWVWILASLVSAISFLAAGVGIIVGRGISFWPLWCWLLETEAYYVLIAAALVFGFKRAVVDFVGDVAVYVNADAKSESFEARGQILKGASKALRRLLKNKDYAQVILAGHSLGSVIAYDTINRLMTASMAEEVGVEEATPGISPSSVEAPDNSESEDSSPPTVEDWARFRGLVTFGSPLDKIYYFFRQHVKEGQPIRAQILSMLHSFKKEPSGRVYTPYEVKRYTPVRLPDFKWLNAYAAMDPVSAKLDFYDVGCQRKFPYRIWGLAHMSYWDDPKFYDWWCGKLLVK